MVRELRRNWSHDMRSRTPRNIASMVVGCVSAGVSFGATLGTDLVVSGLTRPLFVTAPPGDNSRLFIIEQYVSGQGQIRIFDRSTNTLLPTPFLRIPVSQSGEQGLLGLAFHPDYANNGRFYVNYTAPNTFVDEYRVSSDPNLADPNSRVQLLTIDQPYSNHNGGWIGFGPVDGHLYIATGDGGASNDPQNHAQNPNDLLGKILRIAVDRDDFPEDPARNYGIPADNPFVGVDGADEVWMLGLRNPWRCSFDRATGDFWIGDVGQGQVEEIDFAPAGVSAGENFGWRCMEGTRCNNQPGCTCDSPLWTPPIHEYTHANGCSVSGGYVYRGCAIPELHGVYFFADYCSAKIWSLREQNGAAVEVTERTTEIRPPLPSNINWISSFGEDAAGELYICDLNDGEIYRIVDRSARDCDGNGRADMCQSPPPPGSGDANCDGAVNNLDIDPFVLVLVEGRESWERSFTCNYLCTNDMNGDGAVNNFDIDAFVDCIVSGCS